MDGPLPVVSGGTVSASKPPACLQYGFIHENWLGGWPLPSYPPGLQHLPGLHHGNRNPAAIAAILVLLLLGAAVRVNDLRVPRKVSEDEQVYTQQALMILKGGFVNGTRSLAQLYLRAPRLSVDPPPTRFGFVFPLVWVMKFSGSRDERAGAWLSCAASIAALGITALIGLEFFGHWITAIALLFLSLFPPDLFLAQRCWTDSMAGLAGLLLMYLTLKILSIRPARTAHCVSLAAAGAAALLVKDTCVLIYGMCLLPALWVLLIRDRDVQKAGILVGAAALGVAADIGLWTVCTGRMGLFVELVLINLRSTRTNPYTVQWQSCPGYVLLWALRILSPLTVSLAALGMVAAGLPAIGSAAVERPREAAGLAGGVAVLTGIYMFMPHWQSVRFLSPIFGPACLFAGLAVWRMYLVARRRVPAAILRPLCVVTLAVIVASLAVDVRRFQIYLRSGISDLPARLLLYYDQRLGSP